MTTIVNSREVVMTAFIRAKDVQRALGCSRSLAYEHLRRAAGRTGDQLGLLRVSASDWEK